MALSLATLTTAGACGGSAPPPAPPMSARTHVDVAEQREAEAAKEERAAAAAETERSLAGCRDGGAAVASTSGGERLAPGLPCWQRAYDPATAHAERAERLRAEAAKHRQIAASLVETERRACASVPEVEQGHSPTWHRDDIVAVEPIGEGGAGGAILRFGPVPGLEAPALEAAYRCARATAARAGYPPTLMGYCPAVLDLTTLEVRVEEGGLAVVIRAATPDVGAVVWGRASDLVAGVARAPAGVR
ncbi:MAG: hypothetical protein R2939_23110 [Kofleriaceae bacterium]